MVQKYRYEIRVIVASGLKNIIEYICALCIASQRESFPLKINSVKKAAEREKKSEATVMLSDLTMQLCMPI